VRAVEPAAQHFFLATHKRAQPAPNDFDLPESSAPKFDLSLEGINVPHRG
jgi:hypothetical protein